MSRQSDNSSLPVTEADLLAFADNRLADARRDEMQAYLDAHPEEAERVGAWRRQNEEIHANFDGVLDEPVPARLRNAVQGLPRLRRLRPYALAAGLTLAGVGLGLMAGLQMHRLATDAAPQAATQFDLARSAAIAHATYSPEVRHPVEVGADQEAHLVAWLSKRLGTPVSAPKLEAAGYSLVGGRLLPGEGGARDANGQPAPVAQFMYQCKQGTRITLYVSTGVADHGETAFRYEREGNVGVFYWIDRSQGYALSSSDIGKDALLSVANAAYKQLNP